jgi:hypothetical protein
MVPARIEAAVNGEMTLDPLAMEARATISAQCGNF